MKKILILIFILFSFCFEQVNAGHIIGGKFRVSFIDANRIKVQLEIERDCLGSSANLENIVIVGLYSKSTNLKLDELILTRDSIIRPKINYDCSGVHRLIELGYFSAEYTITSNVMNDTNGYYLNWERCCLTIQSVNIIFPESTPFSAVIDIPRVKFGPNDSKYFYNNSPYKTEIFNPIICLNYEFEYNFGFIDDDGDSLSYEIITPIAGGYTSAFSPSQTNGPKPYELALWEIGYTTTNPINSSIPFSFDSITGNLKFKPTELGSFTFAIAVNEYRSGVKIGTVYYQSLFFVHDCVSSIVSQPTDQYSIDHAPVTFRVKHSGTFVTYQWQCKPSLGISFEDIPNATSDSLVLNNITDSMNNNQYQCRIFKRYCNDITEAARLHTINTVIIQSDRKELNVFPNPSNNQITISGIEKPIKLSLYTLTGVLLIEVLNTNKMEVSDISSGMYIIRATDQKSNTNYFAKLRIGQ